MTPSPSMTADDLTADDLTADQLSALSDAQLAEFMKKHRQPDGSLRLPVNDWNTLSKEARDDLAKRLQCIQRTATHDATAHSRPLDLAKLDALLRDASSRDDPPSQDETRARERVTESPDFTPQELYRQGEMEAYNNFVNDGGRPLYPIDLLESVSEDPDIYEEMLKPFWRCPRTENACEWDCFDPEDVFQRQWLRWQNFRKWQLNNRGMDSGHEDDGFEAHADKIRQSFIEGGWLDSAAEIEANPTSLKKPGQTWYYIRQHRIWQRKCQRELGCKSFSDYEGAVKARLARHGFTQPFQLAENPMQQDQLTTWIEYLGFEYWWLDHYTTSFERLKPEHDNAWNELKKQGMVKDDETPEFIRTEASARQRQADRERTWRSVQDAEFQGNNIYQKTQRDPNRLDIPKEKRVQMLAEARRRLSKAREAHDFAKQRSHLFIKFVRGTFDYEDAKDDRLNQMNLLEWVVAEIRLIEDEQRAATTVGVSRRKRKESAEDSCAVQPNSRKQKSNALKHDLPPSTDGIGTRHRRRLRRRDLVSTGTDRPLSQEDNRSIPATHSNQTNLLGFAVQPVPSIEASPESMTLEGRSRKKRKVAFEDTFLTQRGPQRLKSNTRGHGSQTSDNGVGTTSTRVLRVRNRSTMGLGQQPDQHQTQKRIPDTKFCSQSGSSAPSQELSQGLRRSSRLAALRPEPEIHLANCEPHIPGNLRSKRVRVGKRLEKRVRRR